jgi:hypothetical protein
MKKTLILSALALSLLLTPQTYAGDCSNRSNVNWHATVSSATNVRIECDDHKGPVGTSVGVVPAGEVIRIVEVDRNREYFIVETSKGKGFIYKSFLKDINEFAMVVPEPSVFQDLDKAHKYYDEIADVKSRGIVSGSNGMIKAEDPINRVELAKILVEATMEALDITSAVLADGVFSDIEKGSWYVKYLKLARDKGIMTGDKREGTGPRSVRPGDGANGAEVAKMIAIAFDLEIRSAGPGEDWYVPHMQMLEQMGALPYSDPNHRVTRAEMMYMISRVLKAQKSTAFFLSTSRV